MDRVPYRRVTPPRHGNSSHSTISVNRRVSTKSIGETIIVQAIISGLLLAMVLVICLVDIAPLVSLRDRLGHVLNGATTIEEFAADLRQFSEDWLGFEAEPPEAPLAEPDFPSIQEPLHIPLTAYEEPINPHVPGPSMSPGLWD